MSVSTLPTPLAINVSSSGNNTLIAGQVGFAVRITRYTFKVAGAVTVQWLGSLTSVLSGPLAFAANGDGVIEPEDDDGYFLTLPGEGVVINLSAGVAVGGYLKYEYVKVPGT